MERPPLHPDKAGLDLSRARLEASGCELIAYGCKANGEMKGGPSAPLLLEAGVELQESLREGLARTSRDLGEVVLTPAFKMEGPRGILHIVALKKDLAGNWISELEPLAAGVRKALELCREQKAHSVAFSALGATKLTVAPDGSARFMIEAARDYQRKNPDWPLRILFCLPDHNVYQAFLKRIS
jgi:O-acetyl-ADP-ribose deacetylase (regulator of RNase III)